MKRSPFKRGTKPIGPTTYAEALEKAQTAQIAAVTRRRAQQANALSGSGIASQGLEAAKRRTLKAKPDPQLAAWGRKVRKRDGNRCQWPGGCQTGDTRIDPHHLAKRSQRPDLRLDVSNGLCLCRTHHEWTDDHHDEAVAMGLLNVESYEAAQKEKAAC